MWKKSYPDPTGQKKPDTTFEIKSDPTLKQNASIKIVKKKVHIFEFISFKLKNTEKKNILERFWIWVRIPAFFEFRIRNSSQQAFLFPFDQGLRNSKVLKCVFAFWRGFVQRISVVHWYMKGPRNRL